MSDSEEKLEVAWTTDTYDHSGNNGSSMVSQRLQVTGVWDDVSYSMSAAAMDTKFVRTRRPMGPRSIRFMLPMSPSSTLLLSSPNPQYIQVPDCLSTIFKLPVQVVDIANGGAVSTVADIVEVDDEGAVSLQTHFSHSQLPFSNFHSSLLFCSFPVPVFLF